MNQLVSSLRERFLVKVNKTSDCWFWTAARNKDGYGIIRDNGQNLNAHRVAFELFVAQIPVNLQVLHRCDTPSCVNPQHLFLGTPAVNQADKKSKHRSTFGERNPRARLTQDAVVEIRVSYQGGLATIKELASRHGISYGHAKNIVRGRRWTSMALN